MNFDEESSVDDWECLSDIDIDQEALAEQYGELREDLKMSHRELRKIGKRKRSDMKKTDVDDSSSHSPERDDLRRSKRLKAKVPVKPVKKKSKRRVVSSADHEKASATEQRQLSLLNPELKEEVVKEKGHWSLEEDQLMIDAIRAIYDENPMKSLSKYKHLNLEKYAGTRSRDGAWARYILIIFI